MQMQLDGGNLVFDVTGKGTPMLFIHGYPLSRKIWDPQLASLSKVAQAITIDLRGHGDSSPFLGAYSMELLANDCKRVLEFLKIKSPVVFCGLSMGGYISLALYRSDPLLFKGLVLVSTRAAADSAEGKANRDKSILNARQNGAAAIADAMSPRLFAPGTLQDQPELVEKVHHIILAASVNGIVGSLQGMRDRPDSSQILDRISCPTLVVHGMEDQLIPVKEAETMSSRIQNSQLIKVERAGHLLNMEQPQIFNTALVEFIESLG